MSKRSDMVFGRVRNINGVSHQLCWFLNFSYTRMPGLWHFGVAPKHRLTNANPISSIMLSKTDNNCI